MAKSTEAMDRLKSVSQGLFKAVGDKAISSAGERVSGLTDRLEGIADGGPIKTAVAKGGEAAAQGDSPVKGALKGAVSGIKDKVTGGGGKGKGGGKPKFSNVIEDSYVGVPVDVAYNQWTQFQDFSRFTKAVQSVDQSDEIESSWKAKVGWFNRSWQAKVIEQIPDKRIQWTSDGAKGSTKGTVTFHPIGDDLTAVLLNLEVHHKGFIEQMGRPFKVAPRRVHKDLKLYRRFIVAEGEPTGEWRGEIEDGEVTKSHEDALEEEQQDEQEDQEAESDDESEDEYDESEDEYDEDDEGEPEDEEDEEEPEDEDEAEEEPEEAPSRSRRRRAS